MSEEETKENAASHFSVQSVSDCAFVGVAAETLDSIDMGQIMDLIPSDKALEVLKNAERVLRPFGTLRMIVTDFDFVCDAYKNGTGDPEATLCGTGVLNSSIYNRTKVSELVNHAGFEIISAADGSLTWKPEPHSIGITARKKRRAMPKIPFDDVHAIMSLPRVSWTETFAKTLEVASQLQMKFTKSTGVFWSQSLERMMSGIVKENGCKYILTIDYDSIFDARDVIRLWQVMEDNSDIAALCPMQIGRDRSEMLLNMVDENGKSIQTAPVEFFYRDAIDIKNGHFGLTLIRVDALKDFPHPWFLGVPNEEGKWEERRTDDDIYFWHKMRAAGKRVCATPKVRIGHLQCVITWPKDDFSLVHQYVGKFHDDGRPAECMTY